MHTAASPCFKKKSISFNHLNPQLKIFFNFIVIINTPRVFPFTPPILNSIYTEVLYIEILFLVCISTFQLIFRYRKKDTCSYTYTCACKYSIDTNDKSKLLNSNKYHVSIFSELNTDLNGFPFPKIPKQLEFSEVKMKARLLL